MCQATAYRTALDAGLPFGLTLFVNAEPAALGVACPPDLAPTILDAQLRLRVVVEMGAGHRCRPGAPLLSAAEACRGAGWGVALDDVGAEWSARTSRARSWPGTRPTPAPRSSGGSRTR